MRSSAFVRFLFVFYCIEMGTFLLLWPWSAGWDQFVFIAPFGTARYWGFTSVARSVVSAFGVVHLVWGAHDLDLWIRGRRRTSPKTSDV